MKSVNCSEEMLETLIFNIALFNCTFQFIIKQSAAVICVIVLVYFIIDKNNC